MIINTLKLFFQGAALVMLLILFCECSGSGGVTVSHLSCENLSDPLAINTTQPRFSWKNNSNRQGTFQTAYQLLVASSIENLDEENADYWDSGKIESLSSVLVEYNGEPLKPGQLLFWKVRTWDENGNVSPWSKSARFGIGLLDTGDWAASYIIYPSEKGFYSCPQLRTTFGYRVFTIDPQIPGESLGPKPPKKRPTGKYSFTGNSLRTK